MTTELDSNVSMQKCGFVVPPKNGWLSESPDGRVMNPTSEELNGIIEIKSPYSKWKMSLKEACSNTKFCFHSKDIKLCQKQPTLIIVRFSYNFKLVQTCTLGVTFVFVPVEDFLCNAFYLAMNCRGKCS